MATLKLATFNVNNVNTHLPNLLEWLGREMPDIVCLQELKATNEQFPEAALQKAESLGGTRMMGPDEVPGVGITIALFTDPEGHVIGLVK